MNRRSGKDRRKQTAEDFYCGNQWGLLLREPVAWYKPPPPLPRFEHTGRFETHVKKGEWYANEAGNPLYCNFDFETTGLWILRRLDP